MTEFAFVAPILILLFVAIADFGRVFTAGILLDAAARDGAEVAAFEYLRQPPGPLVDPAPSPPDAAYYDDIHLKAARTVCAEMRDLPNTTSSGADCAPLPAIQVCIHDGQDPSCAQSPFPGGPAPPAECTLLTSPPTNAQEPPFGNKQRWVEVRVCYHFTMILHVPWVPLGDVWLQRTRTFVIPCYFALGYGDCG